MPADVFRSIAAAGAPLVVEVEGITQVVRLPTVREAILLQTAAPGMLERDANDARLYRGVLTAWLPSNVVTFLDTLSVLDVSQIVASLLEVHDLPVVEDDSKKKDTGHSTCPDPFLLVSDVAQVYGGSAWHVFNEMPWPFFLHLLARSNSAAARQLLRWAEVEILPHSGKAAARTLKSLEKRARGPAAKHESDHLYAPPELIQQDRARLREFLGAPPVETEASGADNAGT